MSSDELPYLAMNSGECLVIYRCSIKQLCCATSRKVPGSFPGGVTGFSKDIFPSDRTMTLGSTQPLVKMSTRNIPGVKVAGA